jgi:hypothetical protein
MKYIFNKTAQIYLSNYCGHPWHSDLERAMETPDKLQTAFSKMIIGSLHSNNNYPVTISHQ